MRVLKYLSFILMVVALIGFYQSSLLHLSIVRSASEPASEIIYYKCICTGNCYKMNAIVLIKL